MTPRRGAPARQEERGAGSTGPCRKGAPPSAPACALPRCWDLDDSSPYWWIIKGPIVLSVGVSSWGQVSFCFIQAASWGPPRGCTQQYATGTENLGYHLPLCRFSGRGFPCLGIRFVGTGVGGGGVVAPTMRMLLVWTLQESGLLVADCARWGERQGWGLSEGTTTPAPTCSTSGRRGLLAWRWGNE